MQFAIIIQELLLSLLLLTLCSAFTSRLIYPRIALTRELGQNSKLQQLLRNYECVELPCIRFQNIIDKSIIESAISNSDVVVITSPHAAEVFGPIWKDMSKPTANIASVGEGTSSVLSSFGIKVAFTPTIFNAKSLASELPIELGPRVLYPCSKLADSKLCTELENRGFIVNRVDSYTTVPSEWSEADFAAAKSIDVVAFASPSAVSIWAERCGTDYKAACIGATTEARALQLSYREVISTGTSKGVEAWADVINSIVNTVRSSEN